MIPSGEQVIEQIAQQTDTILLSFSRGKDSIAAWLACRQHFKRIIPFHMEYVPGLSFVEESLRYYEDVFQTHIIRLPHYQLYNHLATCVLQPPERVELIRQLKLPQLEYEDVQDMIRTEFGLSDKAYTAVGVRAVDSPVRMIAMRRFCAINHKKRQFMPVWDWKIDRLISELRRAGVKLPVDYKLFGRSFDGVDYRFIEPLRRHRPQDYAKVLEWFPLAELDFKRREYAGADIA